MDAIETDDPQVDHVFLGRVRTKYLLFRLRGALRVRLSTSRTSWCGGRPDRMAKMKPS